MMKHFVPFAIGALVCAHSLAAEPKPGGAARSPNIILFLVDDMGLMDTSVPMLTDESGKPKRHPLNDWYHTPSMERLAAIGTRFENFYAHSLCSPSRISILTGKNSARHRNTRALHPFRKNAGPHTPEDWNWEGLKRGDMTLPGVLKGAGYTTIHVGKGHLGPVGHEGAEPLNLGFDVNVAGANVGAPRSYHGRTRYGLDARDFSEHARPIPGLEKYHGTDTFLTEALTLEAKLEIDKAVARERSFFLYMSHYAVHAPFNSDPRFAANYKGSEKGRQAQAFAALIEGMDKSLGDLMDHLEEKGIAGNTLILFLGDNGSDAPLGTHDAIASSAPLRGRKGTRWEGGVRVPFIAAWAKPDPDNKWQQKLPIRRGAICPEIAACYDLFPTITALVGAHVPDEEKIDGQSLIRLLTGKEDPRRRNEFLSHYPHVRGKGQSNDYVTVFRRDDWKVIYHWVDKARRYELFDLASDPTESRNLARGRPGKLRAMLEAMVKELDSMEALHPVKDGLALEPVIPTPKEPNAQNTPKAGAVKPAAAAVAVPLFTEDFNAEIAIRGSHRQAQSNLPIKHGYDAMPGWTRVGEKMPAHFVERSTGDWALMVVARQAKENIFTLNNGFAANEEGQTYAV